MCIWLSTIVVHNTAQNSTYRVKRSVTIFTFIIQTINHSSMCSLLTEGQKLSERNKSKPHFQGGWSLLFQPSAYFLQTFPRPVQFHSPILSLLKHIRHNIHIITSTEEADVHKFYDTETLPVLLHKLNGKSESKIAEKWYISISNVPKSQLC